MELALPGKFSSATSLLDHARAQLLKVFLSVPWLRHIFIQRSRRLFSLYLLAVFIYLPLALLAPLFVLAIGPVIYGIPHILASMRYLHRFLEHDARDAAVQAPRSTPSLRWSHNKALPLFGALWMFVLVVRLWITRHPVPIPLPFTWPECLALILTLVGVAILYRPGWLRSFLPIFFVGAVAFCLWNLPLWTTGALILLHNWVPFAYWYLAAQREDEKRSVAWAFGIFVAIHGLVFSGAGDGIYEWITPMASLRWARMDYAEIGRSIAPWSTDYKLWFHAVSVYAFGQAIHYFVWLKAIPDQTHFVEVPTSFHLSQKLLVADLGKKTAIAFGVLVLASFGVWTLCSFAQARELYFLAASYHGFMELGALGVARSVRVNLDPT